MTIFCKRTYFHWTLGYFVRLFNFSDHLYVVFPLTAILNVINFQILVLAGDQLISNLRVLDDRLISMVYRFCIRDVSIVTTCLAIACLFCCLLLVVVICRQKLY